MSTVTQERLNRDLAARSRNMSQRLNPDLITGNPYLMNVLKEKPRWYLTFGFLVGIPVITLGLIVLPWVFYVHPVNPLLTVGGLLLDFIAAVKCGAWDGAKRDFPIWWNALIHRRSNRAKEAQLDMKQTHAKLAALSQHVDYVLYCLDEKETPQAYNPKAEDEFMGLDDAAIEAKLFDLGVEPRTSSLTPADVLELEGSISDIRKDDRHARFPLLAKKYNVPVDRLWDIAVGLDSKAFARAKTAFTSYWLEDAVGVTYVARGTSPDDAVGFLQSNQEFDTPARIVEVAL